MKKQEFLAMSLPYGLKVHRIKVKKDFWEFTGERFSSEFHFRDSTYIPIVRPLSDLTKECVQANYNDGKPFVPIVELGKIVVDGYWYLDNNGATVADDDLFLFLSYTDGDGYFYCEDLNNGNLVSVNQFKLFQQLIKWHFDLTTEKCEKVYVTDEFNPYK